MTGVQSEYFEYINPAALDNNIKEYIDDEDDYIKNGWLTSINENETVVCGKIKNYDVGGIFLFRLFVKNNGRVSYIIKPLLFTYLKILKIYKFVDGKEKLHIRIGKGENANEFIVERDKVIDKIKEYTYNQNVKDELRAALTIIEERKPEFRVYCTYDYAFNKEGESAPRIVFREDSIIKNAFFNYTVNEEIVLKSIKKLRDFFDVMNEKQQTRLINLSNISLAISTPLSLHLRSNGILVPYIDVWSYEAGRGKTKSAEFAASFIGDIYEESIDALGKGYRIQNRKNIPACFVIGEANTLFRDSEQLNILKEAATSPSGSFRGNVELGKVTEYLNKATFIFTHNNPPSVNLNEYDPFIRRFVIFNANENLKDIHKCITDSINSYEIYERRTLMNYLYQIYKKILEKDRQFFIRHINNFKNLFVGHDLQMSEKLAYMLVFYSFLYVLLNESEDKIKKDITSLLLTQYEAQRLMQEQNETIFSFINEFNTSNTKFSSGIYKTSIHGEDGLLLTKSFSVTMQKQGIKIEMDGLFNLIKKLTNGKAAEQRTSIYIENEKKTTRGLFIPESALTELIENAMKLNELDLTTVKTNLYNEMQILMAEIKTYILNLSASNN